MKDLWVGKCKYASLEFTDFGFQRRDQPKDGNKGQQEIPLWLGVPISLHVSRQRRAQEGEVSWGHDINYHHLSYLVFWEFLSINIIWTPVQLNCWGLWLWRSLTSHSRMPLTKKTLSEGGVVVLCQNCISIQPLLSIWMLRQEQWIAVQRFRTHSPGTSQQGRSCRLERVCSSNAPRDQRVSLRGRGKKSIIQREESVGPERVEPNLGMGGRQVWEGWK